MPFIPNYPQSPDTNLASDSDLINHVIVLQNLVMTLEQAVGVCFTQNLTGATPSYTPNLGNGEIHNLKIPSGNSTTTVTINIPTGSPLWIGRKITISINNAGSGTATLNFVGAMTYGTNSYVGAPGSATAQTYTTATFYYDGSNWVNINTTSGV
jgi:hypothetical protein